MSFIPTLGRRGSATPDFTSPKREEAIQRIWTFIEGLVARRFRLTEGAASGRILRSNADGDGTWSAIVPSTSVTLAGQTANQTATLLPTGTTGEFLVSLYVQITTAGSGGTFYASLSYTDDVGGPIAIYPTASLPCNATGRDQATVTLRLDGGGLDYTFQIVSGSGSPAYDAHLNVVQVR